MNIVDNIIFSEVYSNQFELMRGEFHTNITSPKGKIGYFAFDDVVTKLNMENYLSMICQALKETIK